MTGCLLPARAAGIALGVLVDAVVGDPRRGHPVAAFGRWAAWLERRLHPGAGAEAAGGGEAGCAEAGCAEAGCSEASGGDDNSGGGDASGGDTDGGGEAGGGTDGGGEAGGGTDGGGEAGSAMRAKARARGVLFTAVAVAAPAGLGVLLERVSARNRLARVLVTAAATWVALGGTSLAREGLAMADALERDHLATARERLTHLCARDPARLGSAELARATVESLAENTSDAVVAPLVWAAVAGVPGVLAYRAVNTLDAMVGYRSPRYRDFGWASARLDDLANLVPARLTGLLTVAVARLVGGSPAAGWRVLRRDHGRHPSPNAGHCEAAAAGALGVQLGGQNEYGGRLEYRPALGAPARAPEVPDVRRAARLGRFVGLAAAVGAVLASAVRESAVLASAARASAALASAVQESAVQESAVLESAVLERGRACAER